jgi:hypothetical protein
MSCFDKSSSYHQVHPRGPSRALQHLSYASARLEENGRGKVRQEDANLHIDLVKFEDLSSDIVVARKQRG